MYRLITLLPLLLLAAACSPQTAVYRPVEPAHYYSPKVKPHVHGKIEKDRAKAAVIEQDTVEQPDRQWKIEEDRFITTHKPEVSAEVLQLPPEKIRQRLDQLGNEK